MLNILRYSKRVTQYPDRLWREQVQNLVRDQLQTGAIDWKSTSAPELHATIRHWRGFVRRSLACLDEVRSLGAPRAHSVSLKSYDGFRIEKIVVESLPGWPVGLALYLPEKPGCHTPVICPCGHGPKFQDDHQIPPQVYARNGFAAALFDMPWMGERARNNDHFLQGAQSMLAGCWSNFYFLADILIVADYLETRRDIDLRRGMAITGVSGGGMATMFMPHADRRVTAIAPVCCTVPMSAHILDGLYTGCLENVMENQSCHGFDLHNLLCLAAPVPCLAMAGAHDELFRKPAVLRAWRDIRQAYVRQDAGDRFSVFMDDCPHKYTLRMACHGVRWFQRWLNPTSVGRPMDENLTILDAGDLDCGTARTTLGMYELTVRRADILARKRRPKTDASGIRTVLKIHGHPAQLKMEKVAPPSGWGPDGLQRYIAFNSASLPLPFLEVKQSAQPAGTILAFGDRGVLAVLHQSGGLGFMRRRMLACDMRGYGELAPEPADYDIYSWCSIDRPLGDLLFIGGRTPLGQQVEDVLRAIDCAIASGTKPEELLVYGEGRAALPAFLGGILHNDAGRIAVRGMLASFRELLSTPSPCWNKYHFLPHVLEYFDLPDVIRAWRKKRVLIIDPADACENILPAARARALYRNPRNLTLAFTSPGLSHGTIINQWR